MVDISSDHLSATSTLLENARTSIAHLEVVTGCDCSDCHQESILISQFVWTASCITLQNLASKDLTWDSWTWTKSCTLVQWGTFDSSSERLRVCWQELVEGQKKCPGENVGRNDVTIFNNQCLWMASIWRCRHGNTGAYIPHEHRVCQSPTQQDQDLLVTGQAACSIERILSA